MTRVIEGLAILVLALWPRCGDAHPLDEVVQGAYLTLVPGAVRLELDLTPGINVAGALLRALDANADRAVTQAEAQGYARRVLAQSTLTVDRIAVPWTLGEVTAPPYQVVEAGGTISIGAVAERPETPGAHVLTYRNDYEPAASLPIANIFLQPGDGWQYAVTEQQRSEDGRQLTVSYTVARQ